MTLAKDERMLDEWKRCQAENEALWAFVKVWDGYDDTHDGWQLVGARDALRQYEKKPDFTYDPDAPLKLA